MAIIEAGVAHAQVGDRNFIEPLIVQDPNPGNTLDLLPSWLRYAHGQTYSLVSSLEKQLGPNFSVQVQSSWNDPSCERNFLCDGIVPETRGRVRSRAKRRRRDRVKTREQVLSGFTDMELLTKYAFFESDEHEIRLAIGSDMFLPAGNPTAGGDTHTYLGPIFMFAKGFGDIPNRGLLRYLRPLAIQGDVEYLFVTGGTMSNDAIADWVVSYSMQYLHDYVQPINMRPRQLFNLNPFAEFSYEQIVQASHGGSQPDLAVLPGIAYMTDSWQISVASALALNRATVEFDHASVITLLSLSLDKFMPRAGWMPF